MGLIDPEAHCGREYTTNIRSAISRPLDYYSKLSSDFNDFKSTRETCLANENRSRCVTRPRIYSEFSRNGDAKKRIVIKKDVQSRLSAIKVYNFLWIFLFYNQFDLLYVVLHPYTSNNFCILFYNSTQITAFIAISFSFARPKLLNRIESP